MPINTKLIRDFPPISATINDDNTGTVTIGDARQEVTEDSDRAVRRAVIGIVQAHAVKSSRPMRVTTTDSEGITVLLVSPEGEIEEEATTPDMERTPAPEEPATEQPTPPVQEQAVEVPVSAEMEPTAQAPVVLDPMESWDPAAEAEELNARAAAHPVKDTETEKPQERAVVVPEAEKEELTFSVLGHSYDLEDYLDDGPATQGFNGWLNKLTGGSSQFAPSPDEVAARRDRAELLCCERIIRQATWQRGSVAFTVANKKGNSAKTPSTIAISGVLASIRGGSVAMMEGSDDPGQLAGRSEGEQRSGIGELVLNADAVKTKAQLEGYAVPQTSFAHTFGSSPSRRAPLDQESITSVAALIDQFYTIRAIDSGNVYTSSAFAGALATSDALLVPMMNASDSMGEAVELFHFLESHDDPHFRALAERAIVVRVSDGRPEYKVERLVKDFMHQTGISDERMFTIPYDAHLAERGAITLAKLAAPTHSALVRIAAALVIQLQDAVAAPIVPTLTGRADRSSQNR